LSAKTVAPAAAFPALVAGFGGPDLFPHDLAATGVDGHEVPGLLAEPPDRTEAKRTAVIVFQELSDRLSGKEARDLLAQLPYQLKTAVIVSLSAQPISAAAFVERVATELEIPPAEARERIRAVFHTIREAISLGEFRDILMELDPEYADLLA
jgi:uncharacterized protein (DUF2267 family)